jgi:short subunit dehydrogenase-like uncharacterized protein
MAGRVVLFGGTGFTGELTARALVARRARPLLAGRSERRLEALAEELGGLETAVVDATAQGAAATLADLAGPGDVLVCTVGPFVRWGETRAGRWCDERCAQIEARYDTHSLRRLRRLLEDPG